MAIGDFTIKVGIDSRKVEAGLSAIGRKAEGLNKAFGRIATSTVKFAAAGAAAATAFAAFGAIRFLKDSSRVAGDLETMTVAFGNLLGSTREATDRLKELDRFSIVTPFNPDEIRRTSLLLEGMAGSTLAVGEGLEFVGNAAASRGKDLELVARNMALVFSGLTQGGEMGEASNQLLQFGLITGQTKARWQEFVKAAKAGDAEFLGQAAALQAMREAFKVTGSEMGQMSTTYQGLVSTLQGNVGLIKEALGGGVNEGLKGALSSMNSSLPQFLEAAESLGAAIGKAMTEALAGNFSMPEAAAKAAGLTVIEKILAETAYQVTRLGTFATEGGANAAGMFKGDNTRSAARFSREDFYNFARDADIAGAGAANADVKKLVAEAEAQTALAEAAERRWQNLPAAMQEKYSYNRH